MSEDWAAIEAEVSAALGDVGFQAVLSRPVAEVDANAGTPWGDAATGAVTARDTFTITVLDDGPKAKYSRADDGSLIARTVRVLTIAADGEAPRMGDTITLSDGTFTVSFVKTTAPAGVALVHEVEMKI